MRNLWLFISKYNAIILFVIFFLISAVILVNNNDFQRASAWNSSNELIAAQYQKIDNLKNYLRLNALNDSLSAENSRLRNMIATIDTNYRTEIKTVQDTVTNQQYRYITAKVINNSINQKNNYITIDRGSLHGIEKGMGVIGPNGIVGIVLNVSPKFATIQSLLHSETRISASLSRTKAFGSLTWGAGNSDSQFAILQDVPNHIKAKISEQVLTSGYSLFPSGIPIGRVVEIGLKGRDSFLNIKVMLSTNFATLTYVYVVKNNAEQEQKNLESLNKTE